MNPLLATKGRTYRILYDRKQGPVAFVAGGAKRHLIQKTADLISWGAIGLVAVNGRVRFADGTEAYAILEIDEDSSGEHGGTGIFLPDGTITFQEDRDFFSRLGKSKDEVFPYSYRYDVPVHCSDHHVGEDGWS